MIGVVACASNTLRGGDGLRARAVDFQEDPSAGDELSRPLGVITPKFEPVASWCPGAPRSSKPDAASDLRIVLHHERTIYEIDERGLNIYVGGKSTSCAVKPSCVATLQDSVEANDSLEQFPAAVGKHSDVAHACDYSLVKVYRGNHSPVQSVQSVYFCYDTKADDKTRSFAFVATLTQRILALADEGCGAKEESRHE